ncbi:protein kinase [Candidatus Zixiibacteriota bacterium]
MVGTTLLHYQIEELLGRGAMGAVYKAFDTRLEVYRALKFLQHDIIDRSSAMDHLLREARTQAKLTHPNIATLHDLGEADQFSFLIMEYVDGPTLDRYLVENHPSLEQRLLMILQITSALQAAHSQGILHRDIKPQNVLVSSDGTVKVTDFGLAKAIGQTTLSLTGETKGTAPYMAPEIYRGESITETGDVWSIGVLTYQVLTGKLPFQGRTFEETALSILNDEFPPLPDEVESTLPGISTFLEKCLQKDSLNRISNGSQALEFLLEIAGDAGIQTSTRVALTVPRKTISRSRQRRLLAVACISAVIVTTIILTTGTRTIRTELIDSSVLAAGQSSPTWVDSGNSLAMIGTLGGNSIEYRQVPLEEGGIREVDLPGDYEWSDLCASPAGALFALTVRRNNPGLYLFSESSGEIHQLSSHTVGEPTWSSDGSMLLYQRTQREAGEESNWIELCLLSSNRTNGYPDSTECRRIECTGLPQPDTDLSLYNPTFILGDTRIAFVAARGSRVLGAWSVPVEGGTVERIDTQELLPWYLRWDEKRRKLLFSTSNSESIHVLNFSRSGKVRGRPHRIQIPEMIGSFEYHADTGRLALLPGMGRQPIFRIPLSESDLESEIVADGFLYSPSISGDGRGLFYAAIVQPGGLQLCFHDLNTGLVTDCLADDPGILNEYAPSPEPGDGRYLAIIATSRNWDDLYLYDQRDEQFILQLTDDEQTEGEPAWTLDGNSLFYTSRIIPRIDDQPDRIMRSYLDRTGNGIRILRTEPVIESRSLGYALPSNEGTHLLYSAGGDSLGILNTRTMARRMWNLGRYPALDPSRRDAYFIKGDFLYRWENWAETNNGEPVTEIIGRLPEEASGTGIGNPKMTISEDAVYLALPVQDVPKIRVFQIWR